MTTHLCMYIGGIKYIYLYIYIFQCSPIKSSLSCVLVLSYACTFVRGSAGESKVLFLLSRMNNVSCYIIQHVCNISNISGFCENCSLSSTSSSSNNGLYHCTRVCMNQSCHIFFFMFMFHVRPFSMCQCFKTETKTEARPQGQQSKKR